MTPRPPIEEIEARNSIGSLVACRLPDDRISVGIYISMASATFWSRVRVGFAFMFSRGDARSLLRLDRRDFKRVCEWFNSLESLPTQTDKT